ncbi:MAG TPA: amino acid adenylation domain-containing protein, partial [Longimicrobiaceae bacterium]|nr:amino acid adenylation domain-containing protein [Longimicrobiaceae bacterium]
PVAVERFGSRLRLRFPPAARRVDGEVFFHHLRAEGVYVGEDHAWHLSTAHGAEELDRVVRAVEETVREMRAGGFLGAPADGAAPAPEAPRAAAAEPQGERELPLSPAQKELWVLSQLSEGASRAYNEASAFRLRGPFDPAAMRAAVDDLTRRHEALRTCFSPGGEVQRIVPGVSLEVPLLDLSSLNGGAEERLREIVAGEVRAVFDLRRAPLLRVRIFRVDEEDHLLTWTMHHIVTDGWSTGLLLSELNELYSARVQGRAPRLRELPSYSEMAAVRAGAGEGAGRAALLEYWKERLGDSLEVLSLPLDRPRSAARAYGGREERQQLDPALLRRLGALCDTRGATLFGVLLAAFRVFLHRLAGQRDLVIGTTVSGQAWDDEGAAVGHFVDLLPLRSRYEGDASFSAFLAGSSVEMMEAIEHRGIPLREVMEELDLARELRGVPLVTVVFNQRRASAARFRFGDAEAERVRVEKTGASFDLIVAAVEAQGETRLEWEYSTDLLDRSTIHRWMRHFETLLEGVAADPEAEVADLPLLGEAERRQVLVEWNDTAGTDPGDEGLHTPFERRAASHPDAVALVGAGERLTYAELNDRADVLARALRAAGVGPEGVVAICAERSVQMVVGILAVLKAGGAYLPLDPAHPADRLGFMLRDARARALLTQGRLLDGLPEFAGPTLLLDGEIPAGDGAEAPAGGAGGASLAYVIYTSGSTGEPKGVMIPHRGIRNRVLWVHETYPLVPEDAVLFKTPYTFDASVWELFLPLWSGARVVVAEPDAHRDPARMVEAIVADGVTVLQLVPSMLQALLAHRGVEACTSLRLLFCGGEAFPVETARSAAERLRTRVVNLYGPTEASIDVTSSPFEGHEEGPLVPIGRPITNTRIYLLDDRLAPVPVGVPGELYAHGPGLARGYLARPGLTAEKFLPDPFGPVPGGRMYRTGDLARRRPDGTIDFLGRADRQVKVRGVRIELGEIESVLARHPAVEAAVVVSRQDGPGDASLAAYFIPAADGEWTPAGLQAHLRGRLPEHMVPSAFVALEEFPRTSSGKLDTKRLPAPVRGGAGEDDGFASGQVPPRSPVEEMVHEIWAEVLRTDPIGVHQSFFELGGHSLSALQLIARMQAVFAAEVPLRTLFETPTIAGLAAFVERARGDGTALQAPPLVPLPRDGSPLPLSFAQQRLWILNQMEPESDAYNLFNLVPLPAGVDAEALEGALTEIVRRHEVLRTTFPAGEGIGEQRIHAPGPVRVAVADFSGHPEGERVAAARGFVGAEVAVPFDLEAGPLLRATLIRTGESEATLLLVMHHIVSDAWSMGVVQEELAALYEARPGGEPSPLPELPVQYADYARWERSWLQGDVLETQLAYWRERLEGAPQVISLPTDRRRPPVHSYRGGSQALRLPGELTDALRRLCQRESVTVFMAMLAAFKVLLQKYGAGDDVVVGTHVAGRSRVEVERLIGFFVNALVLRTDLSGDPSFAAAVGRVRDTALGAFAHQHLPFERVVEELQPQRDLGVTPLYQVSVEMQRLGPVQEARAARSLTSEVRTVKFDLEAMVAERPEEVLLVVAYSGDLFDGASIGRMLRHFEALLRGALADPAAPLSALSILGAEETSHLLHDFQGERRDFPLDRTLAEHFELRAEETPGRIAVVAGGEQLTYGELSLRSNRLARLLRASGVRRGATVGILEERGVDFVTGVLATFKAGGAYVPLAPAYPEGRIRHMLRDSGLAVLLTRSATALRFVDALADSPALRDVVCFDTPGEGDSPLPGVRVHTRED